MREISHGNLIVSIVRSSFKLGLLPLPLLLFRMFVAVTAETRKTMLRVLWGQRVRFLYLWSSFAVVSRVVGCVCVLFNFENLICKCLHNTRTIKLN